MFEYLFPRMLDDGQPAMRVNVGPAQARKMFSASDDVICLQSVEVCARETGHFGGVRPEGTASQPVLLIAAREVQDWRKVDIEAKESKCARRELTELLGQLRRSSIAHGFGRRHRF